jgi:2-oxoglutarate ferredoxin oxidoreductase subunit gamma
VALNQPSVDKFESKIKVGGTIIYDASNIINPPTRSDIKIYGIAGSEAAIKLKNIRVLNLVILGSFIAARKTVSPESIMKALKSVLPERYHHLLPVNQRAFEEGMALIENYA